MRIDAATVLSIARGHRTMSGGTHRLAQEYDDNDNLIAVRCLGLNDNEPCPVDWRLVVDEAEVSGD